jgi:hypothetical protein
MAMNIDAGPVPSHGTAATRIWQTSYLGWLGVAALFAAAMAMRHVVAANTDVSWLLIAGERWLDGQRLYSDIVETNPPMAILIYVPGILIARALGISAEIVVDGLIFAAIAVSLAITARILRNSSALAPGQRWPLALLAVTVLGILPVQVFGQREHIAVIELFPALGVLALRIKRETLPAWAIAIAGLGLGLALSFKPHFVVPFLCCLGVAAFHLKSWRIIFAPEHFMAAAVIAGYGACMVAFFPEYFAVMAPLLRDVYTIGLPLARMLEKPVVPQWGIALIGAVLFKRGKAFDSADALLLAASLGFGLIYFLQRKGWPYHSYPMMVFALLAFGHAMTSSHDRTALERFPAKWIPVRVKKTRQIKEQSLRSDSIGTEKALRRGWLAGASAVLAALFGLSMVWFNHSLDARPLQAAVARLGPHPTILAISGNAGIAHPLTRAVGGVWASREQELLVASYDRYLRGTESPDPQTLANLDGYAAREREWLIADFRKYQPTIVLVDNFTDDWTGWVHASPELVDLLKGYRLSETVMGVDIYVKRAN